MFEPLPDEIVGVSPAAARIRRFVEKAAGGSDPVTLTGEAGTGKELVAKLIHRSSERRLAPFLMIDCSLYYERELRRELFGFHAGKNAGRKGLFEFASEGTCYLSRIEELSLGIQGDVLGFLKSGRFERLGDGKPIASSARLIASSEKDLEGFVEAGLFHGGLYSEISKLALRLAPLRERKEDVPAFVESVASAAWGGRGPRFVPEALAALGAYPWPANFEELRREVLRLLGTRIQVIRPENLTADISSYWLGHEGDPLVRKVLEEIDAFIREYQVLSRLEDGLADLFEAPAPPDEVDAAAHPSRPAGREDVP